MTRGPAGEAELTFAGERKVVRIELRCVRGVPEATVSVRGRGPGNDRPH
ncbi:hypothetical protein [Plantactinospora sp. KBS50]|nr:hypothetical protein [Plantactinospora sp. KBS50]